MYILRFPPHTDIKCKSEEEIRNLGIVCFCFLEGISASLCRVINIINNRNAKQHYPQKIPKQTTKRRREEPPIIHSKTKGNWLSLRRVGWNTAEICFCCWEILFVISFSIYPNNILSKDVILINTINDRKESLNTYRLSTQLVSLPFQKEDPLIKQQNFWKGGCWNLGGYIGFCLDGSWEGFECVYSWRMG